MMKNVFINAMRFAFTGTPVFKFERNTFLEFAYPPKEYYLDVYFIRDSISDNFTLPIVYDVIQEGKPTAEGIKILLENEDIKKYIKDWIESSSQGSVADDIETFLESGEFTAPIPSERIMVTRSEIRRHLNKIRVFLTNERRLKKLASHIAERIEADTENFKFKAMVVTANREACVHIKRFLDSELKKRYAQHYGEENIEKWTEIVMTYQHNDRGVILDYKEELIKRRGKNDTNEINLDIQREFKEEENPKILIVTDMLITGFDAPILKVMYLDKPLYEHRLLQAIARVNRPHKDETSEKKYGLIVDSVGLLRHVRESLKKFQMIADRRIARDVEENVLGSIEKRIEEFKQNLKNLKRFLKDLKVEGRDLSIDIDGIKEEIKTNKRKALETLKEVVDPKTRLIAAFWTTPEIQILLRRLKEVIDLFKALGSHKEKIYYVKDVEILAYIYGKILFYIKGRRVPREFWDGLIELIHEKTLVTDFRTIMKTEINNNALRKVLNRIREKISAKKLIAEPTIADAYRILRSILEVDLANPVYKAIYDRIERAREEWIKRNIDTEVFIKILSESIDEKIKYDEKVSVKSSTDRIIETVNIMINRRFLEDRKISFQLRELSEIIPEIMKAPRITESHERKLRTALLKDLFREMKKVKENTTKILPELKNFAETVTTEYIIKEIEKARKGGTTK